MTQSIVVTSRATYGAANPDRLGPASAPSGHYVATLGFPPDANRASPAAAARAALSGMPPERRRRLTHRAVPLAAIALAALVVGIVVGAGGRSDAERAADGFVSAWRHRDYPAMYGMLTGSARERTSLAAFERAYKQAGATATTTSLVARKSHDTNGGARVRLTLATRLFGTIRRQLVLPVDGSKIDWDPSLVFPGMARGEQLTRRTVAPQRAKILARGGQVLAEGPGAQRTSPLGALGSSIAGTVAPPTTQALRDATYARGFPPGTPVGQNGLERILEMRVAGRPGGVLLVGGRPVARSSPVAAGPVRTTIDVKVQAAAVQALAGRYGGIAAIDPRTWDIRALAGVAFSAPQPPGSTFKIVTVTAALGAGLVKPTTPFPVQDKATIEGVGLENANGEFCGGTLANSFAESCNSVFAPLGVRVGAQRLVDTAERFGFNSAPGIPGALPSTLPEAGAVGGPLAVGSTAIGQGKVLATPLEFATVAATIADDGVRRRPTLLPDARTAPPVRVAPRRVAHLVERLMIGVVQYGTGTAASLAPTAQVAGKTGTAELVSTVPRSAPSEQSTPAGTDKQKETDAWFTGYAPVKRPKLAVCAMFVKAGAGGDVAAPAVRLVLAAGLGG
jgi:peptidoglycan glycosyltransferase